MGSLCFAKTCNGLQTPAEAADVIVAGQPLLLAHSRSRAQRFSIPRNVTGVFPMTHHVECVALLVRH